MQPRRHEVKVLDIRHKEPRQSTIQKKMDEEARAVDAQIETQQQMNRGLNKLSSEQKRDINQSKRMDNKTIQFGYNQHGLFSAGLRRAEYERKQLASQVQT